MLGIFCFKNLNIGDIMDYKTIDRIVWWIPFKQLRNDVRNLLNKHSNLLNEHSNLLNEHSSLLNQHTMMEKYFAIIFNYKNKV